MLPTLDSNLFRENLLKKVQIMDVGEKMIKKCRWYQNDQEGLKHGEKLVSVTWVVGLDF